MKFSIKSKSREENQERNIASDSGELDILEFVRFIWLNRSTVFKFTLVSVILGLFVAFGSKVEYQALCKLLPENQEVTNSKIAGLGNLAGLAGFDLNLNNQNSLSPEIYPEIAKSSKFQWALLQQKVNFEKKDTLTSSYLFFRDIDKPSAVKLAFDYTIGLPTKLRSIFTRDRVVKPDVQNLNNDILRFSGSDDKRLKDFASRIAVEVDAKTGIITLTAMMPDPVAAAEVVDYAEKMLTDYIVEHKTSKASQNLEFIKARCDDAKQNFEEAQTKLALFNDRNRNVITSMAKIEQEKLLNEFNLAFDVYKGLATQLEHAEIKVKEQTPVFTILEPVKVPVKNYQPKRKVILAVFIFLGLLTSISWLLLKKFLGVKLI